MKLAHGIYVLVVDGSRMLLLRNDGDTVQPSLELVEQNHQDNPPNTGWQSDGPGSSQSVSYSGRSTMDQGDPHQDAEDRFVAGAVDCPGQVALADSPGVIVVAPPRALAELRRACPPRIADRIVAEVARELTRHPVDDIARLLDSYPDP